MSNLVNHPRIEMVPRASLTPNPSNPRKHSPKQIDQIMQSLRRFGFKGVLVVDDDGLIVSGNALWEAAGKCGFDELPVIRVRFLSEADRRAFALAHNRLAELAGWDEELLARELEYLFEQDYDLGVTGFEISDLDVAVAESGDSVERPVELPDADATAVSRGDAVLRNE
jgi:ParB-like chromosome segregation protein Spo0J